MNSNQRSQDSLRSLSGKVRWWTDIRRGHNTFCLIFTTNTNGLLVSLLLNGGRRCLSFGCSASSTKEHIRETMANGWTYSNRTCGGSHLRNHARLARLGSRFCRNWSRRGRCTGRSITSWSSSRVRPTRLRWCWRTRSGGRTTTTLRVVWASNILSIRVW